MLSRLEAIQDIRLGRGICMTHVGRFTTFRVILRRDVMRGGVWAAIDCPVMRRTYYVKLTSRQVLTYIRLHYPRHTADVVVQANPFAFPDNYQEVQVA